MIDRTRALIAAAVVGVVALLAVSVGFVAGRATADSGSDNGDAAGDRPVEVPNADGLPAGPSRIEDGIPMGFTQTEDGALAAAASWVPLIFSGPFDERPDRIDDVVADGVDPPRSESVVTETVRRGVVPLAGKVSTSENGELTVDLLSVTAGGQVGDEDVSMAVVEIFTTLVWDEGVEDWRVVEMSLDGEVEAPLAAEAASEYQALSPTGAVLGTLLIEEVPGE